MEIDGYGSGYGDGSGDGDGDGDGYGDGSGDGDGDGYGYGYGYGSGDGDGYGYGYGYGSGDGDGYGYGSGYGSEKQEYLSLILESVKDAAPDASAIAFWKSSADGTPANGGTGVPRSAGFIEEIQAPLKICTERGLHGTTDPSKWKGERLWIVALYGEVQRQDDKVAALKRKILKEIPCFI